MTSWAGLGCSRQGPATPSSAEAHDSAWYGMNRSNLDWPAQTPHPDANDQQSQQYPHHASTP